MSDATAVFDVGMLTAWIRGFAGLIAQNASYLTDLDAAIGDADHGTNMQRGMTAVLMRLDETAPGELAGLCTQTASALIGSVGGASGPLYGTFFLRMAPVLGSNSAVPAATLAAALRAGLAGVIQRGHAEPGDKTMIDALVPAVDTFEAALAQGMSPLTALHRAADAAAAGRDATAPLVARKGRASYLGERSAGHIDPGAASAALLLAAAAAAVGS